MLDYVKNFVKRVDCFIQSGDVVFDFGGVFVLKKCEFSTNVN